MDQTILSNITLEEILKDKPPTPHCSDDKSYGPCLVWTEKTGWVTKG